MTTTTRRRYADEINAELLTVTRYYLQWWDGRGGWVTPTGWLWHGGYVTLDEAMTVGVADLRKHSPACRVRIVERVTRQREVDVEIPACTHPDEPTGRTCPVCGKPA